MHNLVNMAIEQAKMSTYLYRHGAVVANKGRMLSCGYNKLKTNPKMYKQYGYWSVHAECAVLMRASAGDTLVVVRIKKNGSLTCSKPCEKCLRFAKDFGIKTVVYSDWDGSIKRRRLYEL